jgi:hypothetical protein
VAFNTPYGDRVLTGSFDKTARAWDAGSGQCLAVFRGEEGGGCCRRGRQGCSGGRGGWGTPDEQRYREHPRGSRCCFEWHDAGFWREGEGSFDKTARAWDAGSGQCLAMFRGEGGFVQGRGACSGGWDTRSREEAHQSGGSWCCFGHDVGVFKGRRGPVTRHGPGMRAAGSAWRCSGVRMGGGECRQEGEGGGAGMQWARAVQG